MSLKETLQRRVFTEVKAGNKRDASILRTLLGEIQLTEKSGKNPRELNDTEVEKFIRKNIKGRLATAEEYKEAGKTEAVEKEQYEAKFLSQFVQDELTEEETRELVNEVLSGFDSPTMRDMGNIMKAVLQASQGRADGKLVSTLVKESLRA